MSDEDKSVPSLPPVDPRLAGTVAPDVVTPEVLAGLLVEGDQDLVTWALRVALQGPSRAVVYDSLVRDAMREVGDGWRGGRWTISEEHRASQALARALEDLAPEVAVSDRIGPLAVLAAAEGEEHAIGLILLEHVLRESGWSVAYLGQSVPVDDLVRYVAREQARLVALSAALADRFETVRAAVAALRAMPNPPAIMLGGRAFDALGPDLARLPVDWAGGSLQSAQRFAEQLLRRLPPDPGM
ncbi:MAG: cobalamin B12-binding domain-containing protein [Candidatus Limnocylindrales bacterium]